MQQASRQAPQPCSPSGGGLDLSFGDHASGVPTVGREDEREPAQPANRPVNPPRTQGLADSWNGVSSGKQMDWEEAMRRSEFRWTPGGLVQILVGVPHWESHRPRKATDKAQTKQTWLGRNKREKSCNGLCAWKKLPQ